MSSSSTKPSTEETKPILSKPSKRVYAPSYKLDKFPKLTGPDTYQVWQDASEYILKVFSCWDIVIENEKEPEKRYDGDGDLKNEDEIDGYTDRYQYVSAFFLETVDPTWLTVLTTHRTPDAIW
jgi:hypothetical protein